MWQKCSILLFKYYSCILLNIIVPNKQYARFQFQTPSMLQSKVHSAITCVSLLTRFLWDCLQLRVPPAAHTTPPSWSVNYRDVSECFHTIMCALAATDSHTCAAGLTVSRARRPIISPSMMYRSEVRPPAQRGPRMVASPPTERRIPWVNPEHKHSTELQQTLIWKPEKSRNVCRFVCCLSKPRQKVEKAWELFLHKGAVTMEACFHHWLKYKNCNFSQFWEK